MRQSLTPRVHLRKTTSFSSVGLGSQLHEMFIRFSRIEAHTFEQGGFGLTQCVSIKTTTTRRVFKSTLWEISTKVLSVSSSGLEIWPSNLPTLQRQCSSS